MTAKKTNPIRSYAEAMLKRQQCLDYIIANPGAHSPDISDHMKSMYATEDRTTTTERLRIMAANGDLSRTKVDRKYVNAAGKTGSTPTYAHTALRTVAKTHEEVRAETEKLHPGSHRAKAIGAMKKVQPWVTQNIDPDRKAKRNPDAQHSRMARVFAGSSCGMV